MTTSFTLDDIRQAAEAKYGATEIDLGGSTGVTRLLNPLRLSKPKRAKLLESQNRLADTDDDAAQLDQVEEFRDLIRIVAQTPKQAEALIKAVGDDLAVLAEIVSAYTEGTQAGEASASPGS